MDDLNGHMSINNALRHDKHAASGPVSTIAEPSTKLVFDDERAMIASAKHLKQSKRRAENHGKPFEVPYGTINTHLPALKMGQLVDLRSSMPDDIEDQAYDLLNPLFVPKGLKPVISSVGIGDIAHPHGELPILVTFTVTSL